MPACSIYSSRPVAAQDPTVAVQGRACVLWDWRRVAFGGESRSAASLGRRRVAVGGVEGLERKLAGRWEKTVCARAAIEISFKIEIVDAGKTGGRCHYSGLVRSHHGANIVAAGKQRRTGLTYLYWSRVPVRAR